jgi:putative glutamine amidotransferase
MKQYYLQYKPLDKAFCVSDSFIEACSRENKIPLLELAVKDYQQLGCMPPKSTAPVVGFLMGRDNDCYSADWNYLHSLAKTGVQIIGLTYEHCAEQVQLCDGVVLPGGAFVSPESYYSDPKPGAEPTSLRAKAYITCINYAVENGLPLLGICAGAQMIAGYFGMFLFRNFDYVETPIEHKTFKDEAHRLNIFPNNPLWELLGDQNLEFVNSRHTELLAPIKIQRCLWAERYHENEADVELPLQIYAEANDGVPEAWGDADMHILCVQWHPEDLAVHGNQAQQRIYQWLADEIAALR